MAWHPDNYAKRKLVPITGATGAGTDYVVPLEVHSGFNELTEEQTQSNGNLPIYSTIPRAGQKLTISDRTVTKLSFKLSKSGNPNGDVTFCIRGTDDGNVVSGLTKVWADANTLDGTPTWYEVTFDTPANVNEEVYFSCEFSGGDVSNRVVQRMQGADVKADENAVYYITGNWIDFATYDCAYKYTYLGGDTAGVAYLNNLCTDFPNDIRFTDDDGVTELDPFNLDKHNPAADPTHWRIEVKDNLDSNQSIYIYYGKVGASSASNITNTFLFGDDFSGDLSKWDVAGAVGTWAIVDGALRGTLGYRVVPKVTLLAKTYQCPSTYRIEGKWKVEDVSDAVIYLYPRYVTEDVDLIQGSYQYGTQQYLSVCEGGSWTTDTGVAISASDDTWYWIRFTEEPADTYDWTTELGTRGVTDAVGFTGKLGVAGYNHNDAGGAYIYFDYIFARKYIDPEPVVGTPGAEESLILPSSIASLEAFGTSKLNLKVSPSAISSLEAFGTTKLNQKIFANAISSEEAFGTVKINQRIITQAIASSETFGMAIINLFLILSESGSSTEEINLLIDILLRERIGVQEGLSLGETSGVLTELGTSTEAVIVEKKQVYRMVSQIRPLYNIISIIRERYKLNSIIRELYKMKTHVREG